MQKLPVKKNKLDIKESRFQSPFKINILSLEAINGLLITILGLRVWIHFKSKAKLSNQINLH